MAAVRSGDPSTSRMLLAAGADPRAVAGLVPPPQLVWAAEVGDPHAVRLMLESGAKPDRPSVRGGSERETALMAAAAGGHVEVLQLLLQWGADPNAVDSLGRTALVYGIVAAQPEAVRILLQTGARPNTADRNRRTPLMEAVSADSPRRREVEGRLVELLAARGAQVNATAEDGWTPLMLALLPVERGRGIDTEPQALPIVKRLLELGADPNARNADNMSALALARRFRLPRLSTLLTEAGGRVSVQPHWPVGL